MGSKIIDADKRFITNAIPEQRLTHANQLTIKAWNDAVNILRLQTNNITNHLKELYEWLIGTEPVAIPEESSGYAQYVLNVLNDFAAGNIPGGGTTTGDYLQLSGGQMTGNIQVPTDGGGIMDINNLTLVADTGSSITLGNTRNKVSIINLKNLTAPTTSSGTTYGAGTDGQVLMSNGSNVYWGTINTSSGGTVQSVIDLGTITEDPASATNSVLSEILSTGIYKFEYEYTSAPGITSQAYLMYVFNKYGALCQNIICSGNQFIQRIYRGDEGWIIEEGSFATRDEMLIASKQTTATNTSDKIFLIGSKSQYSIGTSTYSHDTVYVDTDGHLYDNGKRVLTTADNVGGGTVSGDYLPKSGGIMTGDIIFDKYKAEGIRVASYNLSGEEQLNQVILTSDTTQTIVGNKQQDNVKLLGSDAPVWNDGTNEHTILTSKGGTITGNLSVGGNLNLNNTKKITHDDTYEYTFPDKSGTVALLSDITSGSGGGEFNDPNSTIVTKKITAEDAVFDSLAVHDVTHFHAGINVADTNGDFTQYWDDTMLQATNIQATNISANSVFVHTTGGLKQSSTHSCFGFSDEGEPVIVNTSGYNGFLLGGALDNGAFYDFPEKPDDAGSMYVLCTSSQGTSGQVLTSNGDGTYNWNDVSNSTETLQHEGFVWTKVTTEESGKLWKASYNETLYETLAHAKYVEFWTVQNNITYLWFLPVSVMRRKEEGTVNYLNITGSINSVSPVTFDTVNFAFSITQINNNTDGKILRLLTTDVWDSISAFKIYY